MNKTEIADRFGAMWKRSRHDAGVSQEYMAKALGVSKKTIQNWEAGLASPSQIMGFEWFDVLGLQPLPYYLELLYPDQEGMTSKSDDDLISKALLETVGGLPIHLKRKLLFLLTGTHGSSIVGLAELLTAYLHIPLEYRLSIALSVLTDYKVVDSFNMTSDHIKPDIELLESSINKAIESVIANKKNYSNVGGFQNESCTICESKH